MNNNIWYLCKTNLSWRATVLGIEVAKKMKYSKQKHIFNFKS